MKTDFDYRECVNCGWRTRRHNVFIDECRRCGGRCLIQKWDDKTVKLKARSKRKVKSMPGQTLLFDKGQDDES